MCIRDRAKPFDPEELESIIRNLLKRREAVTGKDGDSSELAKITQELEYIKRKLDETTTEGSSTFKITPPPMKIEFTPREQSVLDLVAQGLMNKEIAKTLETSVRNVEKYVSRLFSKTGTNSRTELVRFALQHGLTH